MTISREGEDQRMDHLDYIKSGIEKLYKTDPNIHISVKFARPKVAVDGTPAVITGVYRNIFQIEENDNGRSVRHSFQYGDVLIGHVVIQELDYVPTVSVLDKK